MILSFTRKYFRYLSISRLDFISVVFTLGSITIVSISIFAPLIYWAESNEQIGNIKTIGDAIWVSFMIVTTIGFGDIYPVTAIGRISAVPLAATGIGLFGTLAAYLGSIILDKIVRQATTDMLHQQNTRIELLSKQNNELNETIKQISMENKELNGLIVHLSKNNEALNRKIEENTEEILKHLQNSKQS